MASDTLNKHVLQMLSHLNKYPIPDPQMVRDFNWFIKKYNLSVQSGDVTPPIGGNGNSGNTQETIDALNNVIFSEFSFAPLFTTLSTGSATSLDLQNTIISAMYSSMPDVVFNSNRVVGISIEISSSINPDDNDTFSIVNLNSEGVIIETLTTITVHDIVNGLNGKYNFGRTDLSMSDQVYSVNTETLQIESNLIFYNNLELTVDNILGASEYTFNVKYYIS